MAPLLTAVLPLVQGCLEPEDGAEADIRCAADGLATGELHPLPVLSSALGQEGQAGLGSLPEPCRCTELEDTSTLCEERRAWECGGPKTWPSMLSELECRFCLRGVGSSSRPPEVWEKAAAVCVGPARVSNAGPGVQVSVRQASIWTQCAS